MSKAPVVDFNAGRIDSIFADLDTCNLPGAAVGIAIKGAPVYRKGFGLASMDLPLALSPTIAMRIGSTTKHFVAFAYLLLCEAGRATIDDPVGKVLPELNRVAHDVTARQLMGNLSGLREVTDFTVQFSGVSGRPISTQDLLSYYGEISDVNAAPGATFMYNNGGWVILSAMIEKITGQSLGDVLQEQVFVPVGMFNSSLRRSNAVFVPNSASAHVLNDRGQYERAEWFGGIDAAGAGAMVSTIDDMLCWMRHMDDPRIGSRDTWDRMLTPQKVVNGTSTGYSLGLQATPYRGVETLHHAGGVFGGNAQMMKVPAAALDIIVIVNRSDASAVERANRIIDACLPDLNPVEAPFRGPFATGVFRSSETGRIARLIQGGPDDSPPNGQVVAIDGHRLGFAPDRQGVLQLVVPGSFLRYTVKPVGDQSNPSAIHLEDFGNRDTLLRVVPAADGEEGRVAGRYRSESSLTDALIESTGAGVRMHTTGKFGCAYHALECLGEGVWASSPLDKRALPPWSTLAFDERRAEFRFSNVLTRNLVFRRTA